MSNGGALMERVKPTGMLFDLRPDPGGAGWYFVKQNASSVTERSQLFATRKDAWDAYFQHTLEWQEE